MNGVRRTEETHPGTKKLKDKCQKCQKKPVIVHNKIFYCADCYMIYIIKIKK